MYWFGKVQDVNWNDETIWQETDELCLLFSKISTTEVIGVLGEFSKLWVEGSDYFNESYSLLEKENYFSNDELLKSLRVIPEILNKENLLWRLDAEIGQKYFEDYAKINNSQAKMRAYAVGVVTHITAGNVFLSAIDSLLMGLLTKNINLVKLSHANQTFPLFFAKKLKEFDKKNIVADKFSLLSWKGGDEQIEKIIKKRSDVILAWGGEEMIQNYRHQLPLSTKLIELGPKFSFQIISEAGIKDKSLAQVAQRVVEDIIPWNQRACSAPQNLFVEDSINTAEFLRELQIAFENAPPISGVSRDESVEIHKEIQRGLYSKLMNEGELIHGDSYVIHLEKDDCARPSALNRTLIVKRFSSISTLATKLRPLKQYLQTCSYLLGDSEKREVLDVLAWAGVKRFSPLGRSSFGLNGTPHDGTFILRSLVHLVADELQTKNLDESYRRNDSSTLKHDFESSTHPQGYIFSSGGTTGEPKYVHFSYDEFSYVSDMLAYNLKVQGVRAGEVVANLFVPGNMWSSFLAVDKALEKIGVIALPIGGLSSVDNIINYITKFKPQVIMGIPSLLILVAEKMKKDGLSLNIHSLFYAGERLSQSRMDYFRDVWNIRYFGSAGYASVDAGVIGYQCANSKPGEHHLFSSLVSLKVIEGEAVVSPIYRDTLNLMDYHTGDAVELLPTCSCGSTDQKFLLKGRIDDLIQIWSARIRLTEIECVLNLYEVSTYQVIATESDGVERLVIEIEKEAVDNNKILRDLYQMNQDLMDSISFDDFSSRCLLELKEKGSIKRNSRTGKISLFRDHRY